MASTGSPGGRQRGWLLALLALIGIAGLTVLLLALLTNIFERKQEARQTFVRMVEVTEDTMDPKVWGQNWPFQYDSYLKTSLPTTTKYGGRGLGASDGGPAAQKLDRDPWLSSCMGLTHDDPLRNRLLWGRGPHRPRRSHDRCPPRRAAPARPRPRGDARDPRQRA